MCKIIFGILLISVSLDIILIQFIKFTYYAAAYKARNMRNIIDICHKCAARKTHGNEKY